MEALNLEVCENRPCLMNNSDYIEEAASVVSLTLCPTCMRKLRLMSVTSDLCATEERILRVLTRHSLV